MTTEGAKMLVKFNILYYIHLVFNCKFSTTAVYYVVLTTSLHILFVFFVFNNNNNKKIVHYLQSKIKIEVCVCTLLDIMMLTE